MKDKTGVWVDGVEIQPNMEVNDKLDVLRHKDSQWKTYKVEICPGYAVLLTTFGDLNLVEINKESFISMLDEDNKQMILHNPDEEDKMIGSLQVRSADVIDCCFVGANAVHHSTLNNCYLKASDISSADEVTGCIFIDSHLQDVEIAAKGTFENSTVEETIIGGLKEAQPFEIKNSWVIDSNLGYGDRLVFNKASVQNCDIQTVGSLCLNKVTLNMIAVEVESLDILDIWGFFEINVKVATFYFLETSAGVFHYVEKNTNKCFGYEPDSEGSMVSKSPIHPDGSKSLHTYLEYTYGDVPFEGNFMTEILDHLEDAYNSRVCVIDNVRSLAGYGRD